MSKHIGIVSVNYEGTALCYQTICAEGELLMGEHRHPEITIHSFPLATYMGPLRRNDWKGFADVLISSAEKVAGAEQILRYVRQTLLTKRLSFSEIALPFPGCTSWRSLQPRRHDLAFPDLGFSEPDR